MPSSTATWHPQHLGRRPMRRPHRGRLRRHGRVQSRPLSGAPRRTLGGALGWKGWGRREHCWLGRHGRLDLGLPPCRRLWQPRVEPRLLLGGLAPLRRQGEHGAIRAVGTSRQGHVPCRCHQQHERAGLVSRKGTPHNVKAGNVVVAALETVGWEELGGPQVGPQGVHDRG